MKTISTTKMALFGFIWVTLPIVLIILFSTLLLISYTSIKYILSIVIATAIGWFYWEFAILKWIKWALKNKIDKNKILKIGINTLLLWPSNMTKIEKVEASLNK